jgi:hypothetical protein
MDWLKNLFSPFTERAKTPLYGSFIVSWLLWNWKIVFAVLFFHERELGNSNIVDFIKTNYLDWCNGFWFPLLTAVVYIFIMPYINKPVFSFMEKRKRELIDEKLKIGKLHSVSGELYYNLKLNFEDEKKKVLDFEADKLKWNSERTELENRIASCQSSNTAQTVDYNRMKISLDLLVKRHDLSRIMKGRWKLYYRGKDDKTDSVEELEIHSSSEYTHEYYVIFGNSRQLKFRVELVDFDKERNRLNFLKYNLESPSNHCYNVLNVIDNNTLEGHENGEVRVRYVKQLFQDETKDGIINDHSLT